MQGHLISQLSTEWKGAPQQAPNKPEVADKTIKRPTTRTARRPRAAPYRPRLCRVGTGIGVGSAVCMGVFGALCACACDGCGCVAVWGSASFAGGVVGCVCVLRGCGGRDGVFVVRVRLTGFLGVYLICLLRPRCCPPRHFYPCIAVLV